jgi:hypothetical protein
MQADPAITSKYDPDASPERRLPVANVQFEPERTLFVAKSWPGVLAFPFYTKISDALAASIDTTIVSPAPSEDNPVAIVIYPGTYKEKIDLQSWVFLSSASTHQNPVTIDGPVTWTLPETSNTFEVVQLYFLKIGGLTTVDTTKKPAAPPDSGEAGHTTFILNGCFLNGGLRVNGRSGTDPQQRDFVFAATSVPKGTFTIDSCLFEWVAGRLKGMEFSERKGDCLFRIIGGTTVPTAADDWVVNHRTRGICTGDNFETDPFNRNPDAKHPVWRLKDQSEVVFAGCSLAELIVQQRAYADIRSSECRIVGGFPGGVVDRRCFTARVGPTTPGVNEFKFPVPLRPGTNYSVSLQLVGDALGTPPPTYPPAFVVGHLNTGFQIRDPQGNNTWDVIVVVE